MEQSQRIGPVLASASGSGVAHGQVPALAFDQREGKHCIVMLSVGAADAGYCADDAKGGNVTGEAWVLLTVGRGRSELEVRLPLSQARQLAAALLHRANEP